MNAFHVFWSGPLKRRTCGGNMQADRAMDLERKFEDYYLLTLLMSALQYKRLYPAGRLKLYGDALSTEYLAGKDLLDLWDVCDDTTLDRNIALDRFDHSCFYSVGKFFAYREESAPCLMLDVDLILWERIDRLLENRAVVFTHWEDVCPETYWYCAAAKLKLPKGYRLNPAWDFTVMAANTSIVYFQDARLKTYYTEAVIRFMEHNFVGGKFNIIKPELLFVEQRLLPMIVKELGLWERMTPLIDTVWNAAAGTFTRDDPRLGRWHFYRPDPRQLATHTWIAKQTIEKNRAYRDYFCCRLLEYILALAPRKEGALRGVAGLARYFALLERRSGTEELLRDGLVSDRLHELSE